LKESPYAHLLKDADFKRWVDNITRGSATYGYEMLRRMGYVEKRFKKSPKDFSKMSQKQATDFILDLVGKLEDEKKSGTYISNIVKAIRSWLDYNGIEVKQKIKISNRDDLTKFADERPPTQPELRQILNAGDLRIKTACALVGFSGLRIESLGNYLGEDGLKLKDFPELVMKRNGIEFDDTPTMLIIRKNLSKTKKQYFTFLSDEGCDYLKQYLEFRMRNDEKLTPESPIITPTRSHLRGEHIRTTNVGDLMRKAIRKAGFQWRPYVLRRYFDTRLMMAESDGLIIHDWRVFFMGHKGSIEATYTVNKGLPKDVIEKMRDAYRKSANKYLETSKKETGKDEVLARMNRHFLTMIGYNEKEIETFGDLSEKSEDEIQQLIKQRQMASLGLNGNSTQKVVPAVEVKQWINEGWEYVKDLNGSESIIRLPER
jgi:integrase